jgi:poly-gamma-glutamate synthesis protein (capsule biosynthesis protein)
VFRPVAGVLLAAALTACGSTAIPATGGGDAASGPPSTVDPKGISVAEPPAGPVTFAFGGDVHFEGVIRGRLDADPASVFAGVAPVLSQADIAMVNLETAITDRGTPAPKEFTFRAPATAFTALEAGGVDVVSMANNHGMDYGLEGLQDSLAAEQATGFPVIGIGNNRTEALEPYTTTVNGQRIAIIAATDVLDGNLIASWTATDSQPGLASAKERESLVGAVQAARPEADTLVVFLHWGTEGQTCPNDTQPGLAQALIDAGADIVVGSHAHRLIGGGRHGEALVAYGLGNFVFYTSGGPGTETGVLRVTATGRRIDSYSWEPAVISGGTPQLLQGADADGARAAWDGLRSCTDLTP